MCSDWSFDIHKLIRAGLKVLRGHVEIFTDSYSVVISLNFKQTRITLCRFSQTYTVVQKYFEPYESLNVDKMDQDERRRKVEAGRAKVCSPKSG